MHIINVHRPMVQRHPRPRLLVLPFVVDPTFSDVTCTFSLPHFGHTIFIRSFRHGKVYHHKHKKAIEPEQVNKLMEQTTIPASRRRDKRERRWTMNHKITLNPDTKEIMNTDQPNTIAINGVEIPSWYKVWKELRRLEKSAGSRITQGIALICAATSLILSILALISK